MTDRLHPVQKRLNEEPGSKQLVVKWPVYQQELHSVRYKFPLMPDELFQTWSPPPLSASVPLSLFPSLSFSETRVQQEKWIRLRQDMWQTRNMELLWWLTTLAAGNKNQKLLLIKSEKSHRRWWCFLSPVCMRGHINDIKDLLCFVWCHYVVLST